MICTPDITTRGTIVCEGDRGILPAPTNDAAVAHRRVVVGRVRVWTGIYIRRCACVGRHAQRFHAGQCGGGGEKDSGGNGGGGTAEETSGGQLSGVGRVVFVAAGTLLYTLM